MAAIRTMLDPFIKFGDERRDVLAFRCCILRWIKNSLSCPRIKTMPGSISGTTSAGCRSRMREGIFNPRTAPILLYLPSCWRHDGGVVPYGFSCCFSTISCISQISGTRSSAQEYSNRYSPVKGDFGRISPSRSL